MCAGLLGPNTQSGRSRSTSCPLRALPRGGLFFARPYVQHGQDVRQNDRDRRKNFTTTSRYVL